MESDDAVDDGTRLPRSKLLVYRWPLGPKGSGVATAYRKTQCGKAPYKVDQ